MSRAGVCECISFPVDPYRTGEFLLAVSVTPRQSLAAVLHTLRHFSFEGCFSFSRVSEQVFFLWKKKKVQAMCWLSPECECSGVLVFPVLARFSFCERKALGWELLRGSWRRCRRRGRSLRRAGLLTGSSLVMGLRFSQGAGDWREPRGRV